MDSVERQIEIRATCETIFAVYKDVENWCRWDPDTKRSMLIGGLTLGAKGFLTPTKGHTIALEVTAIEENRHFTVSCKTLLFRLDFDHALVPIDGGVTVTHRVRFGGLLKPILLRTLAPRVSHGLPTTLERLKAFAEA